MITSLTSAICVSTYITMRKFHIVTSNSNYNSSTISFASTDSAYNHECNSHARVGLFMSCSHIHPMFNRTEHHQQVICHHLDFHSICTTTSIALIGSRCRLGTRTASKQLPMGFGKSHNGYENTLSPFGKRSAAPWFNHELFTSYHK